MIANKAEYKVRKHKHSIDACLYYGYINGEYAGAVSGMKIHDGVFNITNSCLSKQFRGAIAVRAFREIIDAVMLDYHTIRTRIDSRDNSEIKIVLSAGFYIIGTVSYKGKISVELLKTKEDNHG